MRGLSLPARAVLVAAWLALATPARAHPIPFSYLDLRLEPAGLSVTLTAHSIDLAHDLGVNLPSALLDRAVLDRYRLAVAELAASRLEVDADRERVRFSLEAVEPVAERDSIRLRLTAAWPRAPGRLRVRCRLFPYDPNHQTFVNVYEGGALAQQEILDKDHEGFEYFAGTRRGAAAVVAKFLPAGVHHIFIGADHVLFVFGLLLLGGGLWRILKIVTAFTLAHSLTLALTTLDLVRIPSRIVEPAIALSIIYVGVDNLMVGRQGGRDVRAWIALFFGLIHGFGFAGVLREFGLPAQHLASALVSFNLGVEVGQAAIVAAVVPAVLSLERRSDRLARRVARLGSIAVSIAGAYWFVERLLAT